MVLPRALSSRGASPTNVVARGAALSRLVDGARPRPDERRVPVPADEQRRPRPRLGGRAARRRRRARGVRAHPRERRRGVRGAARRPPRGLVGRGRGAARHRARRRRRRRRRVRGLRGVDRGVPSRERRAIRRRGGRARARPTLSTSRARCTGGCGTAGSRATRGSARAARARLHAARARAARRGRRRRQATSSGPRSGRRRRRRRPSATARATARSMMTTARAPRRPRGRRPPPPLSPPPLSPPPRPPLSLHPLERPRRQPARFLRAAQPPNSAHRAPAPAEDAARHARVLAACTAPAQSNTSGTAAIGVEPDTIHAGGALALDREVRRMRETPRPARGRGAQKSPPLVAFVFFFSKAAQLEHPRFLEEEQEAQGTNYRKGTRAFRKPDSRKPQRPCYPRTVHQRTQRGGPGLGCPPRWPSARRRCRAPSLRLARAFFFFFSRRSSRPRALIRPR